MVTSGPRACNMLTKHSYDVTEVIGVSRIRKAIIPEIIYALLSMQVLVSRCNLTRPSLPCGSGPARLKAACQTTYTSNLKDDIHKETWGIVLKTEFALATTEPVQRCQLLCKYVNAWDARMRDACYCNSSRVRTADHSSCSPPHHIHLNSQFLAKANHQRARGFTRLAFQHKYFKPFIIDEWPVDRSRGGHSHRPYSHSCDCSRSMVNGQSRRNGCGQRSKPPKRVRSTVKAAQKYSQQRSPPYSKCMACQYTGITISGIRWTAQECFYLRRLRSKT